MEDYVEILPEVTVFWNAFWELSGSRSNGMIPYNVVSNWLTEHEIRDFDEREEYRYFIVGVLDRAYLNYQTKKEKKDAEHGISDRDRCPTRGDRRGIDK